MINLSNKILKWVEDNKELLDVTNNVDDFIRNGLEIARSSLYDAQVLKLLFAIALITGSKLKVKKEWSSAINDDKIQILRPDGSIIHPFSYLNRNYFLNSLEIPEEDFDRVVEVVND